MCLGHVLLEEHTPHGLGNHAVIITEKNEALEQSIKKLLESMRYVGFSNFDIKLDRRDGLYKVFEINTRQGRSNYYVTGAGANVAECLVEDWVFGREIPFRTDFEEHLWWVVPKSVAFRYIRPVEYREKMKLLISEGKVCNPLYYDADGGLKRSVLLLKNQLGQHYKYKKYLGRQE